MNEEFLEKYTAALNKATKLTEEVQKKGILHEGVDDQLIRDFEQANAEVERLSNQLLSMNK
jgi:hypothetical protein